MKIIRFDETEQEKSADGRFIYRTCNEPITEEGKNLVIIYVEIPEGVVEQEHYHEKVNEFIYFLTKAVSRVNSKEYSFKQNDILVLSPNDRHQIIAKEDKVRILVIKKALKDKKLV
ncbi:MAG: hypothetical protein JW744_00420 [Candidatus Diapherotrites archaeon]|uniref:Cupin domain-containing protein n=1 Tax=Candidatus Iainarchaeum sp. TaxID=3101447 RepID=A0A938YTK8_9ARCH|nr:hypothetical protein [Candidatus Diapherotrites archaeon]